MVVWVTGATGFVGGATVRRLAARQDDVVAIGRPSSARHLEMLRATPIIADLPDVRPLDAAPRPDVIVHCAAEIFPQGPDAERRSRRVHIEGTAALARLASTHGARLVHLSTTDVYVHETSPSVLDEDSPTGPSALYGRTKLEGERIAAATPGAVVLRPPGIYGPGSRADYVQSVARKMLARRFVMVGDGRARRSWVYVENLVDAIVLAVDGALPSSTYLVTDGAPIARGDLVARIARGLGLRSPRVRVPVPMARVIARSCEILCPLVGVPPPITRHGVRFLTEGFALDTGRLCAAGYRPSWTFDDAIDATLRWVRGS